jgi:hypothetical protein
VSEREGTPWYEHVWQTAEAKRKFEAGELGYRDARELDRKLVTDPAADSAPADDTYIDYVEEAPTGVMTSVDAPVPRSGPPGLLSGQQSEVRRGQMKAAEDKRAYAQQLLKAHQDAKNEQRDYEQVKPGVKSWGEVLSDFQFAVKRPTRFSKPASAPGEAPAAAAPEVAEAPPEDVMTSPEAMSAAATTRVDKTKDTERVSQTVKDIEPVLPAAKAEAVAYPTYTEAPYEERSVEFELPDGRVVNTTPTQMQAILATEKAKEVNTLMEAYRQEDDAARSAGMWAEIVRGVAAVAIAQYGMKHGVNMSGFQLQPIDWTAQQRERRGAFESKTAAKKDIYGTYEDAAKASAEGQREAYKASQDSAWRKYQSEFSKSEALSRAAQNAVENRLRRSELGLKTLELQIRQREALAKDPKMTDVEKLHAEELNSNLNKARDYEAKGETEAAKASMDAAFNSAVALGQTRPDLAGDPRAWSTPTEPSFVEGLLAGISGNKAKPGAGRRSTYAEYQRAKYAPK